MKIGADEEEGGRARRSQGSGALKWPIVFCVSLGATIVLLIVTLWACGVPLDSSTAHVGMDNDCGSGPEAFHETLPNVLFIGDSISTGYGVPLLKNLENRVALQHGGGMSTNGGNSEKGLRCLGLWLGNETWDVVHFNHGLWDMTDRKHTRWWQRFPILKKKTWTEQRAVSLDDYADNMRRYYEILNQSARVVLFATTTPVPRCVPDCVAKHKRSNAKVLQYNAAALDALPADVLVDDLYGAAVGYCGDPFPSSGCHACPMLRKGDIHFKAAGYTALAENVTRAILGALDLLQR